MDELIWVGLGSIRPLQVIPIYLHNASIVHTSSNQLHLAGTRLLTYLNHILLLPRSTVVSQQFLLNTLAGVWAGRTGYGEKKLFNKFVCFVSQQIFLLIKTVVG